MKGFASPIVFALCIVALAAIAGMIYSNSANFDSASAQAEARQAGWRVADARAFLQSAASDALTDAIYSGCNCQNNSASGMQDAYDARLRGYFLLATSALSDYPDGSPVKNGVNLNVSGLSIRTFGALDCNGTVSAAVGYGIEAKSRNSRISVPVIDVKSASVARTNASVAIWVKSGEKTDANFTVLCSQ
ncbi:hypothetical protein HY995_05270 [Candidatus Micrarchaeota archaeon]|nr:hypothetical protein [Candidatus Micrarchaeota archaeon]